MKRFFLAAGLVGLLSLGAPTVSFAQETISVAQVASSCSVATNRDLCLSQVTDFVTQTLQTGPVDTQRQQLNALIVALARLMSTEPGAEEENALLADAIDLIPSLAPDVVNTAAVSLISDGVRAGDPTVTASLGALTASPN